MENSNSTVGRFIPGIQTFRLSIPCKEYYISICCSSTEYYPAYLTKMSNLVGKSKFHFATNLHVERTEAY
jgi:hypothetical protein